MTKALAHGIDENGERVEVLLDDDQQGADARAAQEAEALTLTLSARPWTDVNQDSRVALIRQHASTLPAPRAAHWERELQRLGAAPAK